MNIVLNSSPIIFLSRLDLLESFLAMDSSIFYVPVMVRDEIFMKEDQAAVSLKSLIEQDYLNIQSPQLLSIMNRLSETLGKGESGAIALAVELQSDFVILDDFAARKAAMRLGLNVKGSLGVIKRLMDQGKVELDNVDELYERLKKMNFRVNRKIFDAIFE